MTRRFYGAIYLLDQIGLTTGITDDLKYCFPDRYKKILSIVYFLILEDTDALIRLKNELLNGHRKPEHENQYKKFFIVHETSVRGIRVEVKEDAVRKARKLYGYFVLPSNEVKDPVKALELYRTRDVAEKAFGNLKERLNGRRMLTSSDLALEGKFFVGFIALIYLSYIKGKMQENGLFANYTMRRFLDELDVIECCEAPGYSLTVGEVLKKQEQLYVELHDGTAIGISIFWSHG